MVYLLCLSIGPRQVLRTIDPAHRLLFRLLVGLGQHGLQVPLICLCFFFSGGRGCLLCIFSFSFAFALVRLLLNKILYC